MKLTDENPTRIAAAITNITTGDRLRDLTIAINEDPERKPAEMDPLEEVLTAVNRINTAVKE